MRPATSGGPVRVLLADDHVIVRDGLARLLDGAEGIEVVSTALDALDAGAHGYVLKDAKGTEVVRAVRAAARDEARDAARPARGARC